VPAGSSFQTQLTQINLIKTRQLSDYLEVCVIRLEGTPSELEESRTTQTAKDHLCILKAILAV
jgi:hypothetical protein